MANADAIDRTIDSIRGEIEATKDVGFNMMDFVWETSNPEHDKSGRHCGTVACIAGHASFASGAGRSDARTSAYGIGREFLEITDAQASKLFVWLPHGLSLSDVTPEQAIRTLEHLRDTGEVDWTV